MLPPHPGRAGPRRALRVLAGKWRRGALNTGPPRPSQCLQLRPRGRPGAQPDSAAKSLHAGQTHPRLTRRPLTTIGVSHHGDHRELAPLPLPPQELPLPAQPLQGLPDLHLLLLQEALAHLHERLSCNHTQDTESARRHARTTHEAAVRTEAPRVQTGELQGARQLHPAPLF